MNKLSSGKFQLPLNFSINKYKSDSSLVIFHENSELEYEDILPLDLLFQSSTLPSIWILS